MYTIAQVFTREIDRRIEEVIKVDDADSARVREEVEEYVVTDSIKRQQINILEQYLEASRKKYDGTAIWVSGFFGSGKSSFAKMLGTAIQDRDLDGKRASVLLAERIGDLKADVLLRQVTESVPTEAVIFDVSTDRGIRIGNQSITESMYRLFLQNLGYAKDLDLAELEIVLEGEKRLDAFAAKYLQLHGLDWEGDKNKPMVAIGRASAVMHNLEPATYNLPDSWSRGAKGHADMTPSFLAERCLQLMARRRPDKRNLLFVIDEVGQYVARDGSKLEDLRATVECLGQRGGGRIWVMVTSQEALDELVSGLDQTKVELPRVRDRFPLHVHLDPSDISEVASRRVLVKSAAAETRLRELFEQNRARLASHTRLHAPNVALPELTAERFIELYPLLPYQIDLIVSIVSGLRTQKGASKHVGGANRTIIKLAQQLLIRDDVALAQKPIGTLATLDLIYDLVAQNIASDVQQKIKDVGVKVSHPKAMAVAKAVCLLQYEQRIPRTPENLAAVLHPMAAAESQLADVRAALDALVAGRFVRLGEDGYRIPTPAEDDWERQRGDLFPKEADRTRIYAEIMDALWAQQPAFTLHEVKVFKAGLLLNKNRLRDGHVDVHLTLVEGDANWDTVRDEWRQRSRAEPTSMFWAARLNDAVSKSTVEYFRSTEVLARKERQATTRDEAALVADEKRRRQREQDNLKRLLGEALLAGSVYFRGNDRSPDQNQRDVSKACSAILGKVLPEVFDRFQDAAAKVADRDLEALLTNENLRGLPAVFGKLHLLREEKGQAVFQTETGPLAEVLNRIQNKANFGDQVSGRALADELGKEPFGWDFDVVRLLCASLLRAGKVEVVSKAQVLDNALSLEARNTLTNNNLFKAATFRPKVGPDIEAVLEAVEHFQVVFGQEASEVELGAVARGIQEQVGKREDALLNVLSTLRANDLPGVGVIEQTLEQVRLIRGGNDANAISTFNSSFHSLKEGFQRCTELASALTEPRLQDVKRARDAVDRQWAFLKSEKDIEPALTDDAATLTDTLQKESFFKQLPQIDQLAVKVGQAYTARFTAAAEARVNAYQGALKKLHEAPEWQLLGEGQQARVQGPLAERAGGAPPALTPIAQIRAETEACKSRLASAIQEMLQMVDGNRIATVRFADHFSGGIETPEQLDAALQGLRDECERLIGEGKKVLVQ
jgi:hypothetical protein